MTDLDVSTPEAAYATKDNIAAPSPAEVSHDALVQRVAALERQVAQLTEGV